MTFGTRQPASPSGQLLCQPCQLVDPFSNGRRFAPSFKRPFRVLHPFPDVPDLRSRGPAKWPIGHGTCPGKVGEPEPNAQRGCSDARSPPIPPGQMRIGQAAYAGPRRRGMPAIPRSERDGQGSCWRCLLKRCRVAATHRANGLCRQGAGKRGRRGSTLAGGGRWCLVPAGQRLIDVPALPEPS